MKLFHPTDWSEVKRPITSGVGEGTAIYRVDGPFRGWYILSEGN